MDFVVHKLTLLNNVDPICSSNAANPQVYTERHIVSHKSSRFLKLVVIKIMCCKFPKIAFDLFSQL